ncbi:MAG: DUF4412 domain-containing protein [Candidatus Zhuqueibacterota bacterium]
MKTLTIRIVALAIILMAIAGSASHGFAQKQFEGYWEQDAIRPAMPFNTKSTTTEKEKTFYKTGKFKIENLTTGLIIIFRFDKEVMWTVDTKKKTYTEMTFAQMEAMKNSMASSMQEQMKNMSDEQKQMMEKMMGKKFKSMMTGDPADLEIQVTKTGKSKTLLGYSCDEVLLKLNEEPMMEMWITNKFRMGQEYLDLYKKMGFMKGEYTDEVKKIQGIPLASKTTIDAGMGKMEVSTTVTKIVEQSVPNSEFDLPAGLKKTEHPGMNIK